MKKTVLTLLGLIALCGCGTSTSNEPAPQTLSADQEMKHIQDNPNMPPEAKAQAQAALQKGQAMGQAMNAHPQTK